MIKQHLKTAWRTMVKDKTYATINILGLTIGLAACMLVFTVVIDELSYDKFWKKADDIYKVYLDNTLSGDVRQKWSFSPSQLGQALQENFPEVEGYSSISTSEKRFRIGHDNPEGISTTVLRADTNVLAMLDFEAVDGKLPSFVAGQPNLLITESFRKKHFGTENPVGKTINDVPSWSSDIDTFLITGVIQDIPQNTIFRADMLMLEKPEGGLLPKNGYWGGSTNYYKLKAGTDPDIFTAKMNHWIHNYIENPDTKETSYGLQSLQEVYLNNDYDSGISVQGNKNTVYILIGVGVILILIACINFINLSTARAMKRIKETSLRKILGAQRRQLVVQFLNESLIFFAIGTLLALVFYAIALPWIERFLGHGLSHSLLANFSLFAPAVGFIFLISLFTGIYPAWLTSGFKLSNSLRGKINQSNLITVSGVRKGLVVLQFAMAIFVLVGLFVVRHQVTFLSKKDIGYDKENLLHLGLRKWDGKSEIFKNELLKHPHIVSAGLAGWDLVRGQTSMVKTIDHPQREGEKLEINVIHADFDFVHTLGFQLKEGRHLDPARGNDAHQLFSNESTDEKTGLPLSTLLPESTANMMGVEELDATIPKLGYAPVGILKDFHYQSLHHSLSPTMILGMSDVDYAYMFIRTAPGAQKQAQESIMEVWKEIYPNRFIDAQWVTDILDKQYEAEQKQQTLFSLFSGLMLFLSAMGIFGLIVHAAQQRVKEIGIRKVLGASVSGIVVMLSRDFVKLVLIGIFIASPIAWWAMNSWLEDFAYRIDIQWWMFVLAGAVTVIIALLTVSWQAIRAAVANPVDSLRDE